MVLRMMIGRMIMESEKRYDYMIKVPVRELHNWWFKVTASSEEEAMEKFKHGFNKQFMFDDCLLKQNAGEPVIVDKEVVR